MHKALRPLPVDPRTVWPSPTSPARRSQHLTAGLYMIHFVASDSRCPVSAPHRLRILSSQLNSVRVHGIKGDMWCASYAEAGGTG